MQEKDSKVSVNTSDKPPSDGQASGGYGAPIDAPPGDSWGYPPSNGGGSHSRGDYYGAPDMQPPLHPERIPYEDDYPGPPPGAGRRERGGYGGPEMEDPYSRRRRRSMSPPPAGMGHSYRDYPPHPHDYPPPHPHDMGYYDGRPPMGRGYDPRSRYDYGPPPPEDYYPPPMHSRYPPPPHERDYYDDYGRGERVGHHPYYGRPTGPRYPRNEFSGPRHESRRYKDPSSGKSEKEVEDLKAQSTTVWLGNLPYNYKEEEVTDLFDRFGKLVKVTVPMDRYTGKNKGFAFVEFETRKEAQDAFDHYFGSTVEGRKVRVDWDIGLKSKGTSKDAPAEEGAV